MGTNVTFKIDDVIQHKMGGAKFRIHAILDNPLRYKARRLDTGTIFELHETDKEKYQTTTPPPNEFVYGLGQVFLKKEGGPRIGVISAVKAGVDKVHNEYSVILMTPQGEIVQIVSCQERDITDQFRIRDFKWVILNGNPEKIARLSLEQKVLKLKEELEHYESVLENLVYFDTELANDNQDK